MGFPSICLIFLDSAKTSFLKCLHVLLDNDNSINGVLKQAIPPFVINCNLNLSCETKQKSWILFSLKYLLRTYDNQSLMSLGMVSLRLNPIQYENNQATKVFLT